MMAPIRAPMLLALAPLLVLHGCADGPAKDTGSADTADASPDTADTAEDTDTSAETGETDTSTETGDTDTSAETGETDTDETGDTGDTETGETSDTATVHPPAVILYIGDGMGLEHIAGAGYYMNGASGTLTLEGLPYVGRLKTASLSGITDSAASATVMATGTKTRNGYLGVDRDGAPLETLLERARARGMAVGLVTTDKITGATPSAFEVHVDDRGDDATIAAAYAIALPDVTLGGGLQYAASIMSDPAVNGVDTRDMLYAAVPDGRPLFGSFALDTFPYVADGRSTEPSLPEMTQVAIDWLSADPEGFFLMVEGARIDHASHANAGTKVFQEVAEFDEAVAAGVAWAGSRDHTDILVTADHECGGLHLTGTASVGDLPPVEWRWTSHTNGDVAVYGQGDHVAVIDGQRLDNAWVHAVLLAAIDDAAVSPPTEVPLIDGDLDDIGAIVVTQTQATSFGAGYNQLDGLRLSADVDGIRVGVDGVYEDDSNTVLVLLDLDYGAATGFGANVPDLTDTVGLFDTLLSNVKLDVDVPGVGFDVVIGTIGAEETWVPTPTLDNRGLRGLAGPWGDPSNFAWYSSILNFDDGNVALHGAAALDAGATGATTGGLETLLSWADLFPAGLPASGTTVAVAVMLLNTDGSWIANQVLPPLTVADEPGSDTLTLAQVAVLPVDATGTATGAATLAP